MYSGFVVTENRVCVLSLRIYVMITVAVLAGKTVGGHTRVLNAMRANCIYTRVPGNIARRGLFKACLKGGTAVVEEGSTMSARCSKGRRYVYWPRSAYAPGLTEVKELTPHIVSVGCVNYCSYFQTCNR